MISAALLQGGDGPRIVGLQFGLLNPAQVRRSSVVPITSVALYAKNKPVPGGMNCPRMGTCDRKIVCATCRQDIIKCPGHHGHLDLAAPMYHIGMINIVMKMLRCVCAACSSLLVDIDEFDERVSGVDGRERLTVMGNLCKNRSTCPSCGSPQPKYVSNRYTTSISIDTTGLKFESEEEERAMNAPFTAARARLKTRYFTTGSISATAARPAAAPVPLQLRGGGLPQVRRGLRRVAEQQNSLNTPQAAGARPYPL